MKWIKLYEEFQMGDLNFMSPEEIQKLFFEECAKDFPDLELIKVILDNGLVDVNVRGNDGRSPLYWAVCGGNIALVEYLISVGADVNAKNKWDESPLHRAVERDNKALVELLISAGAKVNAKDERGIAPLHWASWNNNIALVEYLISVGADVDSKDKDGNSPLAWAVNGGHVEIEALLKQHGAVE